MLGRQAESQSLPFYDLGRLQWSAARWSAYLPVYGGGAGNAAGRWVLLGFESQAPEYALEMLNVLVCRDDALRGGADYVDVGPPAIHESPFTGALERTRLVECGGGVFVLGFCPEPGGHA